MDNQYTICNVERFHLYYNLVQFIKTKFCLKNIHFCVLEQVLLSVYLGTVNRKVFLEECNVCFKLVFCHMYIIKTDS